MVEEERNSNSTLGPILELRNIKKSFDDVYVCKEINLSVVSGRVLSVLGPSGCGKTVTIKMIIGLMHPDEGSIYFDGVDVAKFTSEDEFLPIRQRIAMVFQGSALFDSMTVFENISYPLVEHGITNLGEMSDRVHQSLSLVGLPDTADKLPGELSGGMKKRIGIARAIVTNPEVILYDEPTAGLDPINTRRITDLIELMQDKFKATSIVVSHDMPSVKKVSYRVAFFYGGRVRQVGGFDQLEHSEDAIVRGFIVGDPNILLTTLGSY